MGVLHRAYARSVAEVWDTQNRLMHAVGLVRRPVAAQWLVTAACDLKCPHCYSRAGRRVVGELGTDEAKRLVIDPLVELGCELLVLAGGELLLRRDIPELVDYAVSRGMRWAMHTHGLHVPRFTELFRRHPPVLAAISLDGDRSFHDAFRGKAGSWDAAFVAAEILADADCSEVVFGTTITRDNADAVSRLFPLVVKSRAHSWGLHLFAPEGRGHDHAELFPTPMQLQRVAAFARRRRSTFPIELCNEWGSAGAEDLYYRDQPFTCGAGSISLVVSATGDVLPCTTTDPSESEGNVRETPLTQLWRNRFGRFRSGDDLESGECWLQSRNGVRCAEDAFGPVARRPPLWAESVPTAPDFVRSLVSRRVSGPAGVSAVGLAAAGLVFVQACTSSPGPSKGHATPSAQASVGEPAAALPSPWDSLPATAEAEPPDLTVADLERQHSGEQRGTRWAYLRTLLQNCERGEPDGCDGLRLAFADDRERAKQFPAWTADPAWDRILDQLEAGQSPTFADVTVALEDLETRPTFDPAVAGVLWRAVRGRNVDDPQASLQRVRLYAALRRHHRIYDAIKRATTSSGPMEIRPWLKKSAPPPDYRSVIIPKRMPKQVKAEFERATATTWDTVGIDLRIQAGQARLARQGSASTLGTGTALRLGRLDVLYVPVATTLVAGEYSLSIPAGVEVTLHSLPQYLAEADAAKLEARVAKAGQGDIVALDALTPQVAIAHAAIRGYVEQHPDAAGLQTLLVVYDE